MDETSQQAEGWYPEYAYPPLPQFNFAPGRTPARTTPAPAALASPSSGPSTSTHPPPLLASYDPTVSSDLANANFLRDARWSPDGSSLLTVGEDRTIRTFTLPSDLYPRSSSLHSPPTLTPTLTLPQQSAIYSTLWYPAASLADPASFCFLVAGEGTTIRLVDGLDGRIRASYPIIDHRERFIAPHSMVFNLSASKLYCGFDSAIEVFDFARPGEGERIKTCATRKTKGGQKGIISALDFSPHQPGLFAAGTYTGTISLYDEASAVPGRQLFNLKGIEGAGVTQIKFHPLSPHQLFASSRRSSSMAQCWDLRMPKKPFASYVHPTSRDDGKVDRGTNQRMAFGLDLGGRWIVGGDKNGRVSFFDIQPKEEQEPEPGYDDGVNSTLPSSSAKTSLTTAMKTTRQIPMHTFQASIDAIPSVSLHPYLPLLTTSSGARHFPPIPDSDSDSDSSSDSSDTSMSSVRNPEKAPSIPSSSSPCSSSSAQQSLLLPLPLPSQTPLLQPPPLQEPISDTILSQPPPPPPPSPSSESLHPLPSPAFTNPSSSSSFQTQPPLSSSTLLTPPTPSYPHTQPSPPPPPPNHKRVTPPTSQTKRASSPVRKMRSTRIQPREATLSIWDFSLASS